MPNAKELFTLEFTKVVDKPNEGRRVLVSGVLSFHKRVFKVCCQTIVSNLFQGALIVFPPLLINLSNDNRMRQVRLPYELGTCTVEGGSAVLFLRLGGGGVIIIVIGLFLLLWLI